MTKTIRSENRVTDLSKEFGALKAHNERVGRFRRGVARGAIVAAGVLGVGGVSAVAYNGLTTSPEEQQQHIADKLRAGQIFPGDRITVKAPLRYGLDTLTRHDTEEQPLAEADKNELVTIDDPVVISADNGEQFLLTHRGLEPPVGIDGYITQGELIPYDPADLKKHDPANISDFVNDQKLAAADHVTISFAE